jgi:hypothetical protein
VRILHAVLNVTPPGPRPGAGSARAQLRTATYNECHPKCTRGSSSCAVGVAYGWRTPGVHTGTSVVVGVLLSTLPHSAFERAVRGGSRLLSVAAAGGLRQGAAGGTWAVCGD